MDTASGPPLFDDETLKRRGAQEEFVARAQRSSDDVRRTGSHHRADTVHDELQRRLDARRKAILG